MIVTNTMIILQLIQFYIYLKSKLDPILPLEDLKKIAQHTYTQYALVGPSNVKFFLDN